MAAMPDADRAAMTVPLLPRPSHLPSSTISSSSFHSFPSFSSSSSSSPSTTTSAASSPPAPSSSSFPPPNNAMPLLPQPQGPCKALAVLRDHTHTGSISSLSLCGEFLLSASTGGDIVAWQQPDLRRFARFGHGENGGSVKALAAAGGRVFSAHQDGRVRVWRVSRRSASENAFKLVAALPTARDYLGRVFRQASYVQTTARRSNRRLWIEHADSISCLAVAAATVHDAQMLYSGSWDRTLKVWRIADLKCLESIRAHDDAVNAVAADAGVVYSASADGRVKAWEKGKAAHFLQGVLVARDGVSWNALAVSAAERRVYAAGSDGHVAGWDRLGGKTAARWTLACDVKAHDMAVLCLCVVRDLLCTGSADKTIGLWRRQSGGELAKVGVVAGHEGPVKCIQASWCRLSNGCMLYSGGLDKSIRVWWVPGALQDGNGNEQQQEEQEKSFKDQNQIEKASLFLR